MLNEFERVMLFLKLTSYCICFIFQAEFTTAQTSHYLLFVVTLLAALTSCDSLILLWWVWLYDITHRSHQKPTIVTHVCQQTFNCAKRSFKIFDATLVHFTAIIVNMQNQPICDTVLTPNTSIDVTLAISSVQFISYFYTAPL